MTLDTVARVPFTKPTNLERWVWINGSFMVDIMAGNQKLFHPSVVQDPFLLKATQARAVFLVEVPSLAVLQPVRAQGAEQLRIYDR
jgi:hypothetical protein